MGRLTGTEHLDRGDGTCSYCFEEWPCRGSQGATLSGIQRWRHETAVEDSLAASLVQAEQRKTVLASFERHGIPIRIAFGGAHLSIEELALICEKLDAAASSR